MSTPSLAPRLVHGLGLTVLWTLIGLAFASQIYLQGNLLGHSISGTEAIRESLEEWYVYGMLSIPVIWLARHFPPERRPLWRTASVHLGAALVFSLACVVLAALVGQIESQISGESASYGEIFQPLLVRILPYNLVIYGVIVSINHALDYYRKYHERTVQALELEKHLTEARLQALLHQLKPHFLFNTLNGIAALMHTDVDSADRMLVRLSELLRFTMSHTGKPQTPLREEVAFLERYMEIEMIRFRSRLEISIAIDEDLLDTRIPSLILQPLLENAVHHGVEPNNRVGKIEVRGFREGGQLVLTVCDNGGGIPPGGPKREGIGLANTRARLAEIYGGREHFTLANRPQGGLCVRMAIPLDVQSP